jgi:hypothetical protein
MAQLTLLSLTQEFCKRRGLPVPLTVSGAQDDTTLQIWGLLNEGAADIADRYEWQHLRARYTLPTNPKYYTATKAILDLSEANFPGFKTMLNNTFWDLSTRVQIFGPHDARSWELLLAMGVSQTLYNYTIKSNQICVYPEPPVVTPDPGGLGYDVVAVNWAFEYLTEYPVATAAGVAQEFYVNDSDVSLFPNKLILQDLKWRYNALKGLPYAEDMRICEQFIVNLQGQDPAQDLVMDNEWYDQRLAGPGLLVAAGSWKL